MITKTKSKKESLKFNKAYGLPHRLRPETVKLLNKIDRRRSASFNDKLYELLLKYQDLQKSSKVVKKEDMTKATHVRDGEVFVQ